MLSCKTATDAWYVERRSYRAQKSFFLGAKRCVPKTLDLYGMQIADACAPVSTRGCLCSACCKVRWTRLRSVFWNDKVSLRAPANQSGINDVLQRDRDGNYIIACYRNENIISMKSQYNVVTVGMRCEVVRVLVQRTCQMAL